MHCVIRMRSGPAALPIKVLSLIGEFEYACMVSSACILVISAYLQSLASCICQNDSWMWPLGQSRKCWTMALRSTELEPKTIRARCIHLLISFFCMPFSIGKPASFMTSSEKKFQLPEFSLNPAALYQQCCSLQAIHCNSKQAFHSFQFGHALRVLQRYTIALLFWKPSLDSLRLTTNLFDSLLVASAMQVWVPGMSACIRMNIQLTTNPKMSGLLNCARKCGRKC